MFINFSYVIFFHKIQNSNTSFRFSTETSPTVRAGGTVDDGVHVSMEINESNKTAATDKYVVPLTSAWP